jgi:hypothetical protein
MSEAIAVEQAGTGGESGWRQIFLGPHGLRAGWSLLLFVVLTQAIGAGVFFVIQSVWKIPDQPRFTPGLMIAAELVQGAIVLAVTLVMARIERRSLTTYGLPLRRAFGSRFWEGALWASARQRSSTRCSPSPAPTASRVSLSMGSTPRAGPPCGC